jgi:hypothetical protein
MIIIDEKLIAEILLYLGKIYPRYVREIKYVLPDNEKRDEILKHIAYCHETEMIDAYKKGHDPNNAPIYRDIKLNAKGIHYLKNQAG